MHSPADARVVYREGRALADRFHVRFYHFEQPPERPVPAVEGIEMVALPRPSGRVSRMLRAGALIRRALADGAEVIVVHDPELLPRAWALTLRAAGRRPVTVYDVHEDYPSMIASKGWLPAWLRGHASAAFDRLELQMSRRLDVVVAADEHLMRRLRRSTGGPVLVRNHPPLDLFAPGPPAGERPPAMVYVGGVTPERGAGTMARLLARVRERVPDATLTVVGRAPHGDALGQLAGVAGVTVTGEVPYASIATHLSSARLGLALLHDTPKHRRNVPSKVFDYLACGTPFLASDFPNIREAVDAGGVLVDPADEDAVVAAAVRVLTDDAYASALGAAGLTAARERYSFELEAHRLVERIERATRRLSGPAGS